MAGTHATPFLRGKAVLVKPITLSDNIMDDLEGLTLTDRRLKKNGYRIDPFTEDDLMAMRHCKTCGLRVSDKAERRRQKPTRVEKKQEKERKVRMEECLIRKHREALPELRSRADNIPTTQPAAAALAAPAEEDSWEMPWPTDEPADPNSPPQGCVICWEDTRLRYDPESAHGPGGLCRTGYWKNDAKKWVSFEFTLNKYEAKLLVSLLDKSPRPTCLSHSGRVRDGRWTCCGSSPSNSGCIVQDIHQFVEVVEEFKHDMKLFHTPKVKPIDARRAIALDCEMGISQRGESELIWIAAVDFFSGEVLLDSLVYPKVVMKHLSPRFSGVDWPMLNRAKKNNQCLNSRDEARRRLFQWVGPETVIITHGGSADLLSLRWIHPLVLDTLDVENRRFGAQPQRTLHHLAQVLLHRRIQQGYDGHDCLEDAIACRDLAKWYADNLPEEDKVRPDDEFDDEHALSRVDPKLLAEWVETMEPTWGLGNQEKAEGKANSVATIVWPTPEPWED